jgi:hypothetical protein
MAARSRTIAGSEIILQADAASADDELAAYCPDQPPTDSPEEASLFSTQTEDAWLLDKQDGSPRP